MKSMTGGALCYAAAWLFAKSGHFYLSGAGLIGAALYLYLMDYKRTENMLNLRGLFSLSWVGGQGLACLKLSRLGADWPAMTWLCFLAAFAGFYAVFWFLEHYIGTERVSPMRFNAFGNYEQSVFFCACGLTAVSVGCFLIEAAALGYVPLFVRGVPHAYSAFHLTGIHYFTVSSVLVPSLCVIYYCINRGRNRAGSAIIAVLGLIALAIPILCVSRFQLIFAVILAVLTYIQMDSRLNLLYAVFALAALVPLYLLLTVARSHDVTYLNAVFEMKNGNMPIFITQPYMYVANNYDNFNCLVEELGSHSWGLKMLAPLWTLSGLKFKFPGLVNFPYFVNKEELTTLTVFYDAYYDFGIIGVLGLSCILGALAFYMMQAMKKVRNPIMYLFYSQIAIYMMLSFFTTWFSNPTTWFYLAVTGAAAFAVSRRWGTIK